MNILLCGEWEPRICCNQRKGFKLYKWLFQQYLLHVCVLCLFFHMEAIALSLLCVLSVQCVCCVWVVSATHVMRLLTARALTLWRHRIRFHDSSSPVQNMTTWRRRTSSKWRRGTPWCYSNFKNSCGKNCCQSLPSGQESCWTCEGSNTIVPEAKHMLRLRNLRNYVIK